MKRGLIAAFVGLGGLVLTTVALTIGAPGAGAGPSFNPTPAGRFHAPLSSIGLLAVTHSWAGLAQAAGRHGAGSSAAASGAAASSQTGPRMASVPPGPGVIRFINDSSYMPQSETTVAVDPATPAHVLGGVNDTRWFVCPLLPSDCPSGWTDSLSGFTTSSNGGTSVRMSDDLPGVTVGGTFMQSFGDPAVAATKGGRFYYSSLAIDPKSNGNGVELSVSNGSLWSSPSSCVTSRSTPDSNPCWTSTFVAGDSTPTAATFEDKPLIAVDRSTSAYSGDAYVAWDHFNADGTSESDVARCTPSLTCTVVAGGSNHPVSGKDPFAAFTTPVVGSDGTVYVTWCNYGTTTALTPITCKFRSSSPGGTHFGKTRTITTIGSSGGLLGFATEQFRVNNIPALAVDDSSGSTNGNLYFVIDVCHAGNYFAVAEPNLPGDCGASQVLLSRSTDGGTTWSTASPVPGSTTGVTAQPWVTVDPTSGKAYVVYYTSMFDSYSHRLDVEDATSTNGGTTWTAHRLTTVSIEPDADPNYFDDLALFGEGGSFIVPQFGDYLQGTAQGGKLYVLFSATYQAELGTLQTDPFLFVGT
jgi:hypothetical protein